MSVNKVVTKELVVETKEVVTVEKVNLRTTVIKDKITTENADVR
jgi:hypothetical protein